MPCHPRLQRRVQEDCWVWMRFGSLGCFLFFSFLLFFLLSCLFVGLQFGL
jgi:hypothetical protein